MVDQFRPRARAPRRNTRAIRTTNPISIAIRNARIRLDMRQVDVAKKAGISEFTLRRMEYGHMSTVINTESVLNALGLTLSVEPKKSGREEQSYNSRPQRSTLPPT